jgi:hypothetical protein
MDDECDNVLPAPSSKASVTPTRRQVLGVLSATGIGTAAFRRAVAQTVQQVPDIDEESIRSAEWVAGIELTDEERETAVASVQGVLHKCEQMRAVPVALIRKCLMQKFAFVQMNARSGCHPPIP